MTLEQRLQHAARELREVHIDVPPLGSSTPSAPRSRASMLAAPLLVPMMFVIGALFAIGAARGAVAPPTSSDVPAAQAAPVPAAASEEAPAEATSESSVSAPSVPTELEMISDLVSRQRTDASHAKSRIDGSFGTTTTPGVLGPI